VSGITLVLQLRYQNCLEYGDFPLVGHFHAWFGGVICAFDLYPRFPLNPPFFESYLNPPFMKKTKATRLLILVMLLAVVFPLHAQLSAFISSDRPGQANSANSAGANVLQFQLGDDNFFTHVPEEDISPATQTHTMGGNLGIRCGLGESLEVMTLLNYRYDWMTEGALGGGSGSNRGEMASYVSLGISVKKVLGRG
jgi:hypothetical protein